MFFFCYFVLGMNTAVFSTVRAAGFLFIPGMCTVGFSLVHERCVLLIVVCLVVYMPCGTKMSYVVPRHAGYMVSVRRMFLDGNRPCEIVKSLC